MIIMENDRYPSVTLFKLKIIVIILLSIFIVNWYCDSHNIKLVFTVSTEDIIDIEDEDNKFSIGNIVIKIDPDKQ